MHSMISPETYAWMSSALRNIASPGESLTKLRKKRINSPISLGNCPFRRTTSSDSSDAPLGFVSELGSIAKLLGEFCASATSSLVASSILSCGDSSRDLNIALRASLLRLTVASSSAFSDPLTICSKCAAACCPTRERSGFTRFRKCTISESGRNPQSPSNGVIAMVISGLWLSSAMENVSNA
ncbi:hypothetical protein DPV78_010459 [Talaromyces pinophilus]|nr:hypothetical protein DPV78_010459 [Talaromyces pinophilus]